MQQTSFQASHRSELSLRLDTFYKLSHNPILDSSFLDNCQQVFVRDKLGPKRYTKEYTFIIIITS